MGVSRLDEDNQVIEEPAGHSTSPGETFTFFGAYAHAIDNKGRMIIPNAYRDALGESFTIGPTRDFYGIALYPNSVYNQLLADIVSMNRRKPIVQKYVTQFSKLSYRDIQPDSQGRISLPAKLRQRMLGEAKELEISGALDHIRVVDNRKADTEDNSFMDNLEEILEQFGNLDK